MGVWLGPMEPITNFIDQNNVNYSATNFIYESSGKNWEIALTSSGTLSFNKSPGKVDVFLVGGGANGESGKIVVNNIDTVKGCGGKGGNGGQTIVTSIPIKLKKNVDYPIIIGSAAASKDTYAFGLTAYTGIGASGGKGAERGYTGRDATNSAADSGDPGVFAFYELNNGGLIGGTTRYGAGGGGGGAGAYDGNTANAASGGQTTGGNGGAANAYGHNNGSPASSNTGGGGGGGSGRVTKNFESDPGSGGNGGTGIIIIRNHRSS